MDNLHTVKTDNSLRAKRLLAYGYQTIPLSGKRPTVAFKDITITNSFIDDNREAYNDAEALALLCRGLWAIDIDNHTGDGLKSLREAHPEVLQVDTLKQFTKSGGLHIIFKKVKGIEYSQKIGWLDNVDIKAHDNNYIVLYSDNNNRDIVEYNELNAQLFTSRKAKEIYRGSQVFKGSGKGVEAYKDIIEGNTLQGGRNNTLYKAMSYAIDYNVDIEPLKRIIDSTFTESEFNSVLKGILKNKGV